MAEIDFRVIDGEPHVEHPEQRLKMWVESRDDGFYVVTEGTEDNSYLGLDEGEREEKREENRGDAYFTLVFNLMGVTEKE